MNSNLLTGKLGTQNIACISCTICTETQFDTKQKLEHSSIHISPKELENGFLSLGVDLKVIKGQAWLVQMMIFRNIFRNFQFTSLKTSTYKTTTNRITEFKDFACLFACQQFAYRFDMFKWTIKTFSKIKVCKIPQWQFHQWKSNWEIYSHCHYLDEEKLKNRIHCPHSGVCRKVIAMLLLYRQYFDIKSRKIWLIKSLRSNINKTNFNKIRFIRQCFDISTRCLSANNHSRALSLSPNG